MTKLPRKIILQRGYSSVVENSAIIVLGAQKDIQIIRQDIDSIRPDPDALVVGSVEFIEKYWRITDTKIPENNTYPQEFQEYYHRNITKMPKKYVPQNVFVKPTYTKIFTGHVNTTFDEEYYNLPDCREVWVSDIVNFVAEWRVYVSDYKVIGLARYDDKDGEIDETFVGLFANNFLET